MGSLVLFIVLWCYLYAEVPCKVIIGFGFAASWIFITGLWVQTNCITGVCSQCKAHAHCLFRSYHSHHRREYNVRQHTSRFIIELKSEHELICDKDDKQREKTSRTMNTMRLALQMPPTWYAMNIWHLQGVTKTLIEPHIWMFSYTHKMLTDGQRNTYNCLYSVMHSSCRLWYSEPAQWWSSQPRWILTWFTSELQL